MNAQPPLQSQRDKAGMDCWVNLVSCIELFFQDGDIHSIAPLLLIKD